MPHETTANGPPLFPHDQFVNDSERVLSEIKRLLYWRFHSTVQKRRDNAFVAFNLDQVAASGGTANLHIKNPSDSGFSIDVNGIHPSSQFRGRYKIYDEFSSAPSGGTGNGVDSMLLDSDSNPADIQSTINAGVDFTASNTHFAEALPSGGEGGISQGGDLDATKPLIEPGREIVIQLINDSSNQRYGSISIEWVEEGHIYS